MKLKITLDTIEEFREIRELTDGYSIASYPAYGLDETSLQWHKPTLVAVGTPNTITYLKDYILKHRLVQAVEEKGY